MNQINISKNNVCSIGTLCHTAEVLNRCGIRKCAYPFDWVFSDLSVISDCLETKFEKFLDKTYYAEPITKFNDRQSGHKIYHFDFFFHKNPKDKEEDYNYYVRCVNRFNTLLQNEEQKLFVVLFVPHATKHPTELFNLMNQGQNSIENILLKTKNNLLDFNKCLEKYTKNFNLLSIFVTPNQSQNDYKISIENNLHFLEVKTTSISNGIKFIQEVDNQYLDNVIKSIYNFI
jgi:hypothetical protein